MVSGAGLIGCFLGCLSAFTAAWGATSSPQDLAILLGPGLHLATVVYSFGLFALLGLVVGALGGALLLGFPGTSHGVMGLVGGVGGGVLLFLHLSAAGQLDRLAGLPIDHPARWRLAVAHGVISLAVALVVARVGALLGRRWRPGPRHGALAVGFCLVALGSSYLLFERTGPISSGLVPGARGATAQRIAVVGLDGLTFRVLGPMARAGELPTFARLMAEGAWGPLMTYGTASSPRVWTTLATGQKTRVHGIDDFVRSRGRYRATALRSTDRRSPALWNLLGEAGQRVAVVDWLMTFPPEEVNGSMVTRLADRRPRSHPPGLVRDLDSLERSLPGAEHDEQGRRLGMVDRVFGVAEELLGSLGAEVRPDLLALYDNAADAVQHRHWRHHQPDAFDATWGPADEGRSTWVEDVYRHLDRRLGRLLERLGPDTLVLVVSDHGQHAAARPRLSLRLDRLLAELGWLELDTGGRPVYGRSRAYTLVETLWTPKRRVSLNLEGREPEGIVPPRRAEALRDRLERDLRSLRLGDGTPLFRRVERMGSGPRSKADFELTPTAGLWDLAEEGSLLEVGGARLPGKDFIEVDHTISGEHDHRGVLIVHGPGVRRGYFGQRTLSTAAHRLLWHLTDKVDAVDPLLPILRRLGLLDPATTLDLTPTVLTLSGLPVGRDMPGRPLVELFDDLGEIRTVDTYQVAGDPPREGASQDEDEGAVDEEMLERLEALGYVN